MIRGPRLVLAILAILSATACSDNARNPSPHENEQADAAHPVSGIDWHKGDIAAAFAQAKKEDKPVFFYWGAVWCPPCQEIKNTVFKSSEFIALSKLFIPVYLDGDTPQAQEAGERFGVQGYPTMIVFNSAGEEITRIPGGIDISRYNSVLELSLNKLKPTKALVQTAIKDPASLQRSDFTQLAYYSWEQDNGALPEDAPENLFKELSMYAEPYDEVASARLFMQYLVAASKRNSEEHPVRIQEANEQLRIILSNEELVLACWDTLAYWPEIVEILDVDDDQRAFIKNLWQDSVFALRHDPSLSVSEQVAGWLPRLYYHFKETDAPLSAEDAASLKSDLADADTATENAFARQSVVSQLSYIYEKAHMNDEARALLIAELDRSKAPYYFMSSLASLAEEEGKKDEAIDWYRRAFEASTGTATRFQWGGSYVRALIRLAPDKDDLIIDTAASLIKALEDGDEIFTGRNYRVLKRLNTSLTEWESDRTRDALAKRFESPIESLCMKQASGSMASDNCKALLGEKAAG
ncbi:MAG: thioredoxin family protein [Pseudomonadales bacterium]|nr:thioredoxin family protein [Pseudomonadales bacterium]